MELCLFLAILIYYYIYQKLDIEQKLFHISCWLQSHYLHKMKKIEDGQFELIDFDRFIERRI